MRQWLQNVAVIIRGVSRIGIFLLTEHTLPALRLYSVAEFMANKFYESLSWSPDQRDLALAKIYEKAGNIDSAEESFRKAIALRSHEPDNYLLFAQFLARQKRPQDAIRVLEQAIPLAQEHSTYRQFAERRIEELRRLA
jgi:tetratricopeptide (TPR) repeat protein